MQDDAPRRRDKPGSRKHQQTAPRRAPSSGPAAPKISARAKRADKVSGIGARRLAVSYIRAVLAEGRVLDDVIAKAMRDEGVGEMEPRDRALARLIAATALRRRGQIDAVLKSFLAKPLDVKKGNIWAILQAAGAQLLFLDTPAHAAINIAVEQCRADRAAHRFVGLANAVLRKTATKGREMLAAQDAAKLNTPDWMWQRWVGTYGEDDARKIIAANAREAALDISLKDNSQEARRHWSERLGGELLATGSIRVASDGRIDEMSGFADGAWWIQDAAAALPAKLFGDVAAKRIADVCAAPGGKTAQLAAAGALVTAVDASVSRLTRLRENLQRLQLSAEVVQADATTWSPSTQYDGILLDAPCTATGTMRRHPDIAHLKQAADVSRLAALQSKILDNVIKLIRPGGILVFCTCSLEPEEGIAQIEGLLTRHKGLHRLEITAPELDGDSAWITKAGDLRTLPFHLDGKDPQHPEQNAGMDGFFAARLRVGG